jgi:2'-5' RNA ligase
MIIKKYKLFMESKNRTYDYGCVMVYLDISNWERIISNIDENDLYKPEDEHYGRETEPHLTLLYGLHKEVTKEEISTIFKDTKSTDFKIQIDGISIFENDEFDVVKMDIKLNDKLTHYNSELSKLPNSNSYKDYKPHITMAYVKKGLGKKYIDPDYKYTFKDVSKIVFSQANGEKININLK